MPHLLSFIGLLKVQRGHAQSLWLLPRMAFEETTTVFSVSTPSREQRRSVCFVRLPTDAGIDVGDISSQSPSSMLSNVSCSTVFDCLPEYFLGNWFIVFLSRLAGLCSTIGVATSDVAGSEGKVSCLTLGW
jgi:hypothetical protein